MNKSSGSVLVIVSAVGFGSMALCARIAYKGGMDTYSVLALRFLIAALILSFFIKLKKESFCNKKDLAQSILMGISYAAMAWSYFTALHYISSSTVALILYCYPVIVALMAALLRLDKLGCRAFMAILCVIIGLAILLSGGVDLNIRGIILSLGAAILYSAYILIGVIFKPRTTSFVSSFVITLTAGLIFEILACIHGQILPSSSSGWTAIIFLATCGTALAILAFVTGLRLIGPTLASVLSTLEPVVTVFLGVVFLHENMTIKACLGAIIVIISASYLGISSKEEKAPKFS